MKTRLARSANARAARITAALFATLALLVLATPALAQDAEVEIEVKDLKDKPLRDVNVSVTQESSGYSASGVTNKKGKFEIRIPNPNGTYSFTFSKEGLATHTEEYPISAGKVTTGIKLVDQETMNKKLGVDAFNDGVSKIQGGDEDGALAAFQKAAEILPDDPTVVEAHRLIAIILAGRGEIDTAATALDKYLGMNPAGLQAAAPAAYPIFRAKGDPRLGEVRDMLTQLGIASDFAITVFNEGVKKTRADDKDGAMADFQEALLLNPNLSNAYQSMAAIEFNEKNYEAALPHLAKLTELDPQNGEGQRLLLFSLINTGQIDKAKGAATAWGAINPSAPDQILEQAKIKFEQDDTATAEAMFQMVLDLDGEHADGNRMMGMLHARKGRADEAKKFLNRFLELSPNHPEAESARAMIAGL